MHSQTLVDIMGTSPQQPFPCSSNSSNRHCSRPTKTVTTQRNSAAARSVPAFCDRLLILVQKITARKVLCVPNLQPACSYAGCSYPPDTILQTHELTTDYKTKHCQSAENKTPNSWCLTSAVFFCSFQPEQQPTQYVYTPSCQLLATISVPLC